MAEFDVGDVIIYEDFEIVMYGIIGFIDIDGDGWFEVDSTEYFSGTGLEFKSRDYRHFPWITEEFREYLQDDKKYLSTQGAYIQLAPKIKVTKLSLKLLSNKIIKREGDWMWVKK